MEISDSGNATGLVDSKNIFAQRRERLRPLLWKKNLDALLVSNAANRFYLSGFELHDPQPNESAGMLVITASGEDWLATDSRYAIAAEKLWDKNRIFIYGGGGATGIGGLLKKLASIAGFECKNVSVDFARKLRNTAYLVPADGLVEKLRIIKDESEIKALRASFALNHKMFDMLAQNANSFAGREEKEISWIVEKFFRENGAQELAFATIAAVGRNGAQPHAVPGADKLDMEMPLLVDAGCRVDNYCSDQTRTLWVGEKPEPVFEKTLGLVRDAQKAALDMMAPGVKCSDVYVAARAVFEKAGVAKFFNHGLGHGVGLETHEEPRLSPHCNTVLKAGMVVTVEPGLYYPEWGGARWEHTVLVEAGGVEIL